MCDPITKGSKWRAIFANAEYMLDVLVENHKMLKIIDLVKCYTIKKLLEKINISKN